MPESYDLTKLDPNSFEHMVNLLALRVLGSGHTGFGPGSDGGRDGYFEGEAPYPSQSERWSGRWYIQSKFHKPHLSKDPQKWLIERVDEELKEFAKPDSKRKWPDNWILASNIEPSGAPATGAFDVTRERVKAARPQLDNHFHIWGGSKILQLLALHPEVAEYYAQFLTPGYVLSAIYNHAKDERAELDTILRHLIVRQFGEQQYTKLEQAGSDADTRPGIHRLFIDLPFRASDYQLEGLATEFLVKTAAKNHRIDPTQPDTKEWKLWQRHPSRSRVWFVRGGPGQGKSTIGQYVCQLQRAALILEEEGPIVVPSVRTLAEEVRQVAESVGFWPSSPRVPLTIELREYAQWFGQRDPQSARGILTFLAEKISAGVEQEVLVGTIKRALEVGGWLAVFDGLDEVPNDVKDKVASEVCHFVDNIVVEKNCDLLTLCTSRPQGYSGQFSEMDGPTIDLANLSVERALMCAKPVLELGRTEAEATKALQVLEAAIQSSSVQELMTTPLQSHIMAVVIRDGGRPPDRRWQLFTNFYQVIRRREANRNLADERLAKLLREDEQLLKTVHNRLGFVLQARAETSQGAQTSLNRTEFEALVKKAVELMKDSDIESTIEILMEATTNRLVLVSTPDDGNSVRFDIRPLQEFFAAEFLYDSVDADELRERMETLSGDSHWREVIHFLMSALVENNRKTELAVAVSVLEELDEGGGDQTIRLLNRRLARGAILAARLLQEGVLEQDKRIRQQFRKCMEPITGLFDRDQEVLTKVSQPNSKGWLLNFLIEVLHEANWTENVGATIALMRILMDDDSRVKGVRDFLLEAPPAYVTTALSGISVTDGFINRTWVLDLALQFLLRESWRTLSKKELAQLIKFLSREKETTAVAASASLSPLEAQLLSDLTYSPDRTEQKVDIDCGFVAGRYFSHDWMTEDSDSNNLRGTARGVLEVVNLLRRFSSDRTLANLLSVLDYLGDQCQVLEALPSHLLALFPIDDAYEVEEQSVQLKQLTEEQFSALIEKHRLGDNRVLIRPRIAMNFGQGGSLEEWRCLLKEFPAFALICWSDWFWRRAPGMKRPEAIDSPESVDLLIDRLMDQPVLLLTAPHIWGRLFERSGSRELDLRRALVNLPPITFDRVSFPMYHEFYTFRVNLPSESSLLPSLISGLCAWRRESHYGLLFERPSEKEDSIVQKIASLMGDDESRLIGIVDNQDMTSDVRAAGLLSLLMHPKGDAYVQQKGPLLTTLCHPNAPEWFFEGVVTWLELLTSRQLPTAKRIIGELLEVARNNYGGRRRLDSRLRIWRETSEAPVHKANIQEQWLTGG